MKIQLCRNSLQCTFIASIHFGYAKKKHEVLQRPRLFTFNITQMSNKNKPFFHFDFPIPSGFCYANIELFQLFVCTEHASLYLCLSRCAKVLSVPSHRKWRKSRNQILSLILFYVLKMGLECIAFNAFITVNEYGSIRGLMIG